jgi:hypothetical protein
LKVKKIKILILFMKDQQCKVTFSCFSFVYTIL